MKNICFQFLSKVTNSAHGYNTHFALLALFAILVFPISVTMAAPQRTPSYSEAEKASDAEIIKMEKECLLEDEKPSVKRKPGFRQSVPLGNDTWAFVISGEKLQCIKASMCGTAGCQLKVISNASGSSKVIYGEQVRGWKIINDAKKMPTLRLDVHGSHCGKSGSDACFETMDLGSGAVSIIK